jgi:hypothetical protein
MFGMGKHIAYGSVRTEYYPVKCVYQKTIDTRVLRYSKRRQNSTTDNKISANLRAMENDDYSSSQ